MSERMSEEDVTSLLRVLDRHQGGVEVLGSDALADAIDECIITITKLRAELTTIKGWLGKRFMRMTWYGPFCELCHDYLPHKTDCPLNPVEPGELARIDALRAELTAARTVEDGEVTEMIARLRGINFSSNPDDYDRATQDAIDLLTRLSAAKAEAERERDEARAALAQARGALATVVKIFNDDEDCGDRGITACAMNQFACKGLAAITPTQERETP